MCVFYERTFFSLLEVMKGQGGFCLPEEKVGTGKEAKLFQKEKNKLVWNYNQKF